MPILGRGLEGCSPCGGWWERDPAGGRGQNASFGLGCLAAQGEAPLARFGHSELKTQDVVWCRPWGDWSVTEAHRKLLLDRFCQQAAKGSWIDDEEANQNSRLRSRSISPSARASRTCSGLAP